MSTPEEAAPEPASRGGTVWDWPNQQTVREDESGPGVDDGGGPAEPAPGGLDAMTKDELLAYGQSLGISPMHQGMNKDEIRAAIDQHEAGG